MTFLDWCLDHRILVAVYPPHSTHRLQPLDVSLFSPLATFYSQQLDNFIRMSQGISSLSKQSFFILFWQAYCNAFSVSNINSGFTKTGIYPFNPEAVLGQLQPIPKDSTESNQSRPLSSSSVLSASDWKKVKTLLKEAIEEADTKKAEKLSNTIIHVTTLNAILQQKVDAYKRALFEDLRAQDSNGATFFSPKKIQQAKDLQEQTKLQVEKDKSDKLAQKEQQRVTQQLQQQMKQQSAIVRQEAVDKKRALAQAQASKRAAAKESSQASRQLEIQLKQSVKKAKNLPSKAYNKPFQIDGDNKAESLTPSKTAVTKSG